MQSDSHKRTGYLPVTMAAYELTENSGFYKEHPGRRHAVNADDPQDDRRSRAASAWATSCRSATIEDEELEEVWGGKKTAKQALDATVKRGNELLERFEKANKH